ncbi:hypothetical protein BDP27DRAFT_1425434 [Rhodocollybia butyracea]|uniref:Uncharacterized protein n=1 Tax=Rhodocollybia butyracea TaxID=206335 RepID=A0A9P5PLQ8_9AGAR|nr:hypothetical protein BDP27DRAFT_1425434 [Rhodocollybia butyracea]
MSGGNKRRNSASVHSQKKPKTSGSQPSKKANGPEKPRQFFQVPSHGYFRVFLPSFMSGGNKCRNSASVHSQKKPKTSGSQPSKKANGPEKPRQVGHVQAYARTFDASAEGAIPKELRKDGLGWFVL